MISAQDSGKSFGFEPWPGHCVVFFWQDTLLSQCLSPPRSINEYRRTVRKPDEMLGGYLQWTSIPSRRISNIPSCFMLWKPYDWKPG